MVTKKVGLGWSRKEEDEGGNVLKDWFCSYCWPLSERPVAGVTIRLWGKEQIRIAGTELRSRTPPPILSADPPLSFSPVPCPILSYLILCFANISKTAAAASLVSPENLLVLGVLNNELLATVELRDQRLALDNFELLFGLADQGLNFGWVGLVFGSVECIAGAADSIVAEVVGGEFGRVVEEVAVKAQDLGAVCKDRHC